jgi:ribonuclease HI
MDQSTEIKELYVFIDGSCINNQSKKHRYGGYGVFFGDNDERNVSKHLTYHKITNNTAELMACLEALTILEKSLQSPGTEKIYIVTDSKYLYNSCIDWIPMWEKNGWKKSDGKPVDNKDLLVNIREKYKKVKPIFKHVNSHRSEPDDKNSLQWKFWYGNMKADLFATSGSASKSI